MFSDELKKMLRLGRNPVAYARAVQVWKEAREIISPVSWHGVLSQQEFHDRFHPHVDSSHSLSGLCARADKVCLMAVTIGVEVEERAQNYRDQGDAFKGQLLDRMGSFLVEAKLRRLNVRLSFEWGRKGFSCTDLLSPGSGDVPLEAGAVFATLVDSADFPITLTPDRRISPEKTRTGFMGLIPEQDRL
ncbi:MAG: hypothetical protein ACLFTB_07865 [Desulfovibrionales bacterium]